MSTAITAKMYRPTRRVRIERVLDSWMVLYVDRRKHQKKSAASFYAPDHDLAFVEQWVKDNPRLELHE